MSSIVDFCPNLEEGKEYIFNLLVAISWDRNPFTWEFFELMWEKYQKSFDDPNKLILTPCKFWLGNEHKTIPRSLVLKNAVVYVKNNDRKNLFRFKSLTFYG